MKTREGHHSKGALRNDGSVLGVCGRSSVGVSSLKI